eukprot:GFYU01010942.1.p1 GENE.GFYU01010942.1~~GFYU01010942.1.p1  ORF type:complete len:457 (-),score=106.05 GFYU01010942.1:128-1498(-)
MSVSPLLVPQPRMEALPVEESLLLNLEKVNNLSDTMAFEPLLTPLTHDVSENTPRPRGKSHLTAAIFNAANSSLGAGVLALPFAFQQSGLILGLMLLAGVCVMNDFSFRLLIFSYERTGSDTYDDMALKIVGYKMSIFVQGAIILLQFGVCVAYTVIIADLVPSVLKMALADPNVWYVSPEFLTAMVLIFMVLPLAMMKNMHSLRYTSFFALMFIAFVVCAIVVRSFESIGTHGTSVPTFSPDFFATIPILAFGFTNHPQLLPIFSELVKATPERMNKVTRGSMGVCAIFYVIVGLFGMMCWGDATAQNILINYENDHLFTVAKVAITFTTIFSIPLLTHVLRAALHALIFTEYTTPFLIRFAEVFLTLAGAYGLAIAAGDVGKVFAFTGATCCVLICWVLPGLFYLKLTELDPDDECDDDDQRWWKRISVMVFVGVSACIGIICVVAISVSMAQG